MPSSLAVRSFAYAGDEAGVVDEELHVGEALRHHADVAALAVLVGLPAERQALVDADDFHAERARLLDEADADLVGEEIALSAGAVLRVGLPRAHAPLLRELVHALEVAGLVRVHAAVQQQPVRALQLVDDAPHRVGRLDRHRLGLARRGHEGQHHQVGVAVHEHVLDEHLRALRVPLRGVDEVSLHVEDQLVLRRPGLRSRELLIQRSVLVGMSKNPPVLPARPWAWLNASKVLAAPQDETRKRRREMPSFLELTGREFVRQAIGLEVRRRTAAPARTRRWRCYRA